VRCARTGQDDSIVVFAQQGIQAKRHRGFAEIPQYLGLLAYIDTKY
jgi:hypothetical protein